jgi:ribosomal protein S27AE
MERLTRDAVIAALRAVGTEHEHEWLTERGKQAHKVVEKLADWLESGEMIHESLTCPGCGDRFVATHGNQTHCTSQCSNRARQDRFRAKKENPNDAA